jgi:hypothetical protein
MEFSSGVSYIPSRIYIWHQKLLHKQQLQLHHIILCHRPYDRNMQYTFLEEN